MYILTLQLAREGTVRRQILSRMNVRESEFDRIVINMIKRQKAHIQGRLENFQRCYSQA